MVSSLFSLIESPPPGTSVVATKPFEYRSRFSLRHHTGHRPYPGFGVEIVRGVVWFWLLEQWQDLPNVLWAWKNVTVWTIGHYYYGCSIWVPSLLLFDFWEYRNNPVGFLNSQVSTSVIDRRSRPSLRSVVVPRLFEIYRNSGDSRMARTCRLVCREWAREFPVRDPMDCDWRFDNGVVRRWVGTEWQVLPTKFWVWKLVERAFWCPKLLWPIELELIDRKIQYPPTPIIIEPRLSLPSTSRPACLLIWRTLPPELFQYICDAADGKSGSFRLVCRYWREQCTPHVFRQIDMWNSPERIRALWRCRMDIVSVRHMELIVQVPWYHRSSKFPWIHLLAQTCTSTQHESTWQTWGGRSHITIFGPFAGGHRAMRSVHFALPRSLPRALSRGIKSLCLRHEIYFRRFEDLVHLVCELPDLEVLTCSASFGSLPTELPRRRPRTNRNKLRECHVDHRLAYGATLGSYPGLLEMTLYMAVYDAASFFSEAEILSILALLKNTRGDIRLELIARYSYDPRHHSQTLDFMHAGDSGPFLALHTLRDPNHGHPTLNVALNCNYGLHDNGPEDWAQVYREGWKQTDADTGFREKTAPLRHARFVLGFNNREQLKSFAQTVLDENTPAIFKEAGLRYGIWDRKAVEVGVKDKRGNDCKGAWRQAFLDSEEVKGPPRHKLIKLYS